MNIVNYNRIALCVAISFVILFSFGAYADVPGTIANGTDWVINIIRLGMAIFIVVLALTVGSGGMGVGRVFLVVCALAAAVSAREIASLIG